MAPIGFVFLFASVYVLNMCFLSLSSPEKAYEGVMKSTKTSILRGFMYLECCTLINENLSSFTPKICQFLSIQI